MKSIQYAIFCENYYLDDGSGCNNFEDYTEKYNYSPKKHFMLLG